MSNTAIEKFTSGLEYGIVPGAPAISLPDIQKWRSRTHPEVAHHFVERYEELRREYEALLAKYALNKLVYDSEIRFEPVIGQIYYLYEKSPGVRFLSLVSPRQTFWSGFLHAVRLTTAYTWEVVTVPDMIR